MQEQQVSKIFGKKIWFVNIVLTLMGVSIIVIEIFRPIQSETLKVILYALTAVIPTYFIYEAIGLYKHFKVDVKDPTKGMNNVDQKELQK